MEPTSTTTPKLHLVEAPPSAETTARAAARWGHAVDGAKTLGAMVAGGMVGELLLELARALGVLP